MDLERYARNLLQRIFYARDGHRQINRYRKEALSDLHSQVNKNEILEALKELLTHAYNETTYYRKRWDEAGFNPAGFKDLRDLSAIPFVTKDVIQHNKESMVAGSYRKRLKSSRTGGSSGNPVTFYLDKTCADMRMGRQAGILEFCGYQPGDRCGLLWGAHFDLNLSLASGIKNKLREFAAGKRTLCCTVMEEDKMAFFHGRLLAFRPKILYGYPNALSEFAAFIERRNLPPIHVERVFCTAEALTMRRRKQLNEAFRGEVYNLYCTREHGCMGFECKEHDGFHLDSRSVFVETINLRETGAGLVGDIVVTDLLNYGMPLIRNRIGDVGLLSEEPCACGCSLPLLKHFSGRESDFLYKKDGTPVAGLMLLDLLGDVGEVEWIQMVQESIATIDIFLVVNEGYNESIGGQFTRQLNELFDGQTAFRLHVVDQIPRNGNSGKFSEVICRLSDAGKQSRRGREV